MPAARRFALMHYAAPDVNVELLTRTSERQEPIIAIEELAERQRTDGREQPLTCRKRRSNFDSRNEAVRGAV